MTTPFVPFIKVTLNPDKFTYMILLLYQVFSVAKSFRALSVVKAAGLWLCGCCHCNAAAIIITVFFICNNDNDDAVFLKLLPPPPRRLKELSIVLLVAYILSSILIT
jgi:hypothetical protein